MTSPMPAPRTSIDTGCTSTLVVASMRESRKSPTAVTAVPAIGNIR